MLPRVKEQRFAEIFSEKNDVYIYLLWYKPGRTMGVKLRFFENKLHSFSQLGQSSKYKSRLFKEDLTSLK